MKKYEYCFLCANVDRQAKLNQLGAEGWLLVSVEWPGEPFEDGMPDYTRFVFVREIQPPATAGGSDNAFAGARATSSDL
jgi:hypothetical protein